MLAQEFWQSVAAGTCSGVVQTITSHPLDSCKVLCQTGTKIPFAHPLKLYNGVFYPLLFSGIVSALTFSINNGVSKRLKCNHFVSGYLAGTAATFLITPIDYCKIQKQMGRSIDWRKIFGGFFATFHRESISFATYFGTYRLLQDKRKNHPMLHGGIAGSLCWFVTYPLDTAKTRIQSGSSKTIFSALKKGKWWRGLAPCLLRSFIANSCGFYAYEKALSSFQN